jgi:hypothetical protein
MLKGQSVQVGDISTAQRGKVTAASVPCLRRSSRRWKTGESPVPKLVAEWLGKRV